MRSVGVGSYSVGGLGYGAASPVSYGTASYTTAAAPASYAAPVTTAAARVSSPAPLATTAARVSSAPMATVAPATYAAPLTTSAARVSSAPLRSYATSYAAPRTYAAPVTTVAAPVSYARLGQTATAKPHLIYAPLAGRAELSRLIAAAGELEITESANMANFGKPVIEETGESKRDYVSPSGMPLLQHGDFKMSQSGPIETYIASIAPKYAGLTVQQRAVDNMYQGIKEELLLNCAKAVFNTKDKDAVTELLDKWFAIFEEKVPDDGFIQGLGFPTPADLAILNVTIAFMPFGAAKKLAGYDFDKWTKVKALCDRTAAYPPVAKYLESSEYTMANPMGF